MDAYFSMKIIEKKKNSIRGKQKRGTMCTYATRNNNENIVIK